MKLLFDLFPVILFFIAYKLYDIYTATAVAIVAAIAQVFFYYIKHRTVEKMHLITAALILLLGGLTLALNDETFIKWKPTLVNWGFALVFWGSHYIGSKPIIRRMLGEALSLPDAVWARLSMLWITFFIFTGALNLFVAYTFDTDTWVNFKLFGLMGLTLVFLILQGLYLAKYLQDERKESE
ncbi:MAG TPA: septation protein A [Piscirickettsiaceae bacterium]|nr:septation protein A [Piscirickettsiaceae bacterium]HIQ39879.1 septation protein A [Sulfurivirga caldicuralii]